jgi:hypothetical protein
MEATASKRVEQIWASVFLLTALVWCLPLTVTTLNDGLGIARRDGEVILIQGPIVRHINQTLGQAVWWAQRAGLALAVVCGALGLAVLMRNATIRPSEVFAYNHSAAQTYPFLIWLGIAFVAAPIVVEAGRSLWLLVESVVTPK